MQKPGSDSTGILIINPFSAIESADAGIPALPPELAGRRFEHYQTGLRTKTSGPRKGATILIVEWIESVHDTQTTPTGKTMLNLFGLSIDPANLEGSVVTSIDTLIEKQIKSAWPASTNLPHLNAAIDANMALAEDLMNVYALSKLEGLAGQVLTKLAAKFPMAAPEIAALKSKLPL